MLWDMTLTLREAAREAGTSKSSLHRAIKAGRLSATRTDTGELRVDPSELARAYPERPSQPSRAAHTGSEPLGQTGAADGVAGAVRDATVAALETEVRLLRQMLDDMKAERADLKADRDAWKGQAERLALTGPARPRRPWWAWRRSA